MAQYLVKDTDYEIQVDRNPCNNDAWHVSNDSRVDMVLKLSVLKCPIIGQNGECHETSSDLYTS